MESAEVIKRRKLNSESRSSHTPYSRSSTPTTSSAKNKLLKNLEEQSSQRLQMVSQLLNQQDDEVDLFMRNIALTIKKLPPLIISQAKLQILTLVTNLQAQASSSEVHNSAAPHTATMSPRNSSFNTTDEPNTDIYVSEPEHSSSYTLRY